MHRVSGIGVRVQDLRFGGEGFNTLHNPKGFRVTTPPSGFGFRVSGCWVPGLGIAGFGVRADLPPRRERQETAQETAGRHSSPAPALAHACFPVPGLGFGGSGLVFRDAVHTGVPHS